MLGFGLCLEQRISLPDLRLYLLTEDEAPCALDTTCCHSLRLDLRSDAASVPGEAPYESRVLTLLQVGTGDSSKYEVHESRNLVCWFPLTVPHLALAAWRWVSAACTLREWSEQKGGCTLFAAVPQSMGWQTWVGVLSLLLSV